MICCGRLLIVSNGILKKMNIHDRVGNHLNQKNITKSTLYLLFLDITYHHNQPIFLNYLIGIDLFVFLFI